MASDLNSVNLVGRCARDGELKAAGDTSVLTIRLAFTSQRRNRDTGTWDDQPNYVDVKVFGKRAESLSSIIGKGDRIGISGRLSWREWESKDGKRQALEVLANDVQLLGAPRNADTPAPANDLPIAPAPVQPVPSSTDDIPF